MKHWLGPTSYLSTVYNQRLRLILHGLKAQEVADIAPAFRSEHSYAHFTPLPTSFGSGNSLSEEDGDCGLSKLGRKVSMDDHCV
jgi:hypothetical protein